MSGKGLCNCKMLSQIMFNTGENCEAIPSRSFIAGLSNTNGFHIPIELGNPMSHVVSSKDELYAVINNNTNLNLTFPKNYFGDLSFTNKCS